jgi:Gluconate 2-dehydrogenase subunit 3/Glycogen recognition site of AMP-activated protein kinase
MAIEILRRDDQYIFNHCAKFLARDNVDPRHDFGQYPPADLRSRICEAWRFPIIDSHSDGINFEQSYSSNQVTFVYLAQAVTPREVSVVGTFANLYEPIPLRRVQETPYYTVTLVVPKGEIHTYKFIVDGQAMIDPVNPQQVTLDNGKTWSRFFTQLASQPISFERWELAILARFTNHILPFETESGRTFLSRFYDSLDRQSKDSQYAHAYRLDQPVGVTNFIDKLVAREESHHLMDYKICVDLIDRLLRQRNPYVDPAEMPKELYRDLYLQMATDNVPGWDTQRYRSPRYFLQLLRRHVFTGAFSHPKYGGNSGAAGWAYLEEKYRDDSGQTLFNWRRIMEKPLGTSADYHG